MNGRHAPAGLGLGLDEGDGLGATLGLGVGVALGAGLGEELGAGVGTGVGAVVGCGVDVGAGAGGGEGFFLPKARASEVMPSPKAKAVKLVVMREVQPTQFRDAVLF
ncbi:MAG: hypothetical protein AB1540_11615 [Bdellovibrionota bacterium]